MRILFVCHGNICRSPMAQFIMSKLVEDMGKSDEFEIDSAATTTEEIGNPVYPAARRVLALHGILKADHRARQVTIEDYNYFDKIYVMDRNNLRNIMYLVQNDPNNKVSLLLGNAEIEDPWYTDNFEKVYNQILQGCTRLISEKPFQRM